MLWQTAMLWSKASRFVFNGYYHWNLIFFRNDPGKPAIVLHSKEGSIQSDVFGRQLFAIAMMPLCTKMQAAVPRALQPWYADDGVVGVQAQHNAACRKFVIDNGPCNSHLYQSSK